MTLKVLSAGVYSQIYHASETLNNFLLVVAQSIAMPNCQNHTIQDQSKLSKGLYSAQFEVGFARLNCLEALGEEDIVRLRDYNFQITSFKSKEFKVARRHCFKIVFLHDFGQFFAPPELQFRYPIAQLESDV